MARTRADFTKITEILIMAKTEIMPTRLLRDTRLAYSPHFWMIEKLTKLRFLEIVFKFEDGRNRSMYRTTDKGNLFIRRVLDCYAMIDDNYMEKIIKKVRAA